MTQQELEKYLWGAATALRGTIERQRKENTSNKKSEKPKRKVVIK